MSTTTNTLKMVYRDEEGNNLNYSFKYFDVEASASNKRAFRDAIITNGSIFKVVPVSFRKATYEVKTVSDVDFS